MSDLDLVMEAFKKAKTQGDTINAKHFAQMAVDLEQQTAASFAPSDSYLTPPIRDPSAPIPVANERSFLLEARDVPVQLGKGLFTGTRFLTDVFGADNPASQALSGVEDWLDSLLSAQSKRDQQEIARIMQEAEDKGAGAQVLAGLKALTVAPVDLIVNAFGTSGPTLVAAALASVAGAPALGVATGVGVLTGVGITKDAAYDAVFQELVGAGVSEADARETAKEAQAYGGENLDQIALGGFLGAVAARFGLESKILTRVIGQRLAGGVSETGLKNAAKYGLIKEVSRTALAEALPEALQGGQEQFTRNIALKREGFDVPLGRGVVAGATLEGAVGAPVGAISALGSEGIKPRGTRLAEAEAALTGMLETQEEEAEVRAAEEKVTEEEKTKTEEWLAPYETEAQVEADRKADIAKELERDIDDPIVTEEFEKRQREWREKGAEEVVDEEKYLETTRLEATEAAFQNAAGPDASAVEIKYVEDALEGALGLELQQAAEGSLGPELRRVVEGRAQGREAALRGELGPEAQRNAEEYLEELELRDQDVIEVEEAEGIELQTEEDLTGDEQEAFASFLAMLTEEKKGKTESEKQQTQEDFLRSLTERQKDEVLGGRPVGNAARRALAKVQVRMNNAYATYQDQVRSALRDARYTDKKAPVYVRNAFRKYRDAEKEGTIKKTFPDISAFRTAKIKNARQAMDKINAKWLEVAPDTGRPVIRKANEEPITELEEAAEEEVIAAYNLARSDKTLGFTSNDTAAVYPVSGPRLRDAAKKLTGAAKDQALAIQKYFRMTDASGQLPANPEMALEELAIEFATEPKLAVDEIMANPPRAFRSTMSGLSINTPPKASLLKEAQNLRARGTKRGEEERTTARSDRIQNAVAWVEGSALSDAQKEHFEARVKEVRQEFKEDIIASVKEEQLDEAAQAKQRKGQIAKELTVSVKDPIVSRVFDEEINIDEAVDELEALAERGRAQKEKIAKTLGVAVDDPNVLSVYDKEMTLKQAKEVIKTLEGDLDAAEPISNKQVVKEVNELTEEFENQETNVTEEEYIKEEALKKIRKKFGVKTWPQKLDEWKAFNKEVKNEETTIRNELRESWLNLTPEERAKHIAAFTEEYGEDAIQHIAAGDYKRFPNYISPELTATAKNKEYRSRKALEDARPVDPLIEEYAKTGNLKRTIEALLGSEPKELRPFLRKLRARATGTRIAITPLFDATGNEGAYFPDRNIIALDPEYGLNKLTFFHELAHAALDRSLTDPNSKEAKAFFEFYSAIQIQMGDAYGGSSLQEFVAEFVSNSEFQNLLKTIKAPKSDSFWVNVVNTILELFGIRKGQSAYDASFKFLDDILTARPSIEATPIERTFLGGENPDIAVKEAIANLEPFSARRAKEVMQDVGGPSLTGLKTVGAGALRLDNLWQMYGKELPGIKQIIDAVEKRQGKQEKDIEAINKKYNNFHIVAHKYKAQYDSMGTMALDMRLARVDIFDAAPDPSKVKSKKGKALEEERLKAYNRGKAAYEKLNTPIQNMYKIMRRDFDRMYEEYVGIVLDNIQNKDLRAKIKERFDEEPPIAGYIPARRYGEFVLKYKDKDTNKDTVTNFESASARDREIKALGLVLRPDIQEEVDADARAEAEADAAETEGPPQEIKKKEHDLKPNEYYTVNSIKDITQRSLPPEGFIKDLMDAVEEDGEKQKLGRRQINSITNTIYEAYVDLFPETSVTKSFKRSADVPGASEDILRVYGDTMVKWARKIADIRYNGAIQEGFQEVRRDAAGYPNKKKTPSSPSDSTIQAVGQGIADRETFTLNPSFHPLAAWATTGSYAWFMAGNVSTGVVNLSSIPLLTLPILAAKFGPIKTANMLTKAGRLATNEKWGETPKYKVLYDKLRDHAQLRHTLEREVLEGARQSTQEYTRRRSKFLSFLSIPISATEKYNRATTGMAAFDLAKSDGQSDEEAAEYALGIVKDVNTSGMASTAPKWMQSAPGRVMWTFKGFIWQSTYIVARAFINATTGETRAVKREAFKQLLYMYGMSYAVGGMFGLPLFGAVATLAQMVAAMADDDDEEPFNFRATLITMGLPEWLLKGPINYKFNIEISNRASIANGIGFRENPYEVEKFGYFNAMALQLGGPMGSYLLDSKENIGLIAEGEFVRGAERLFPSFVRNGLKSTRYLREGVRTQDGRPIDTDLSATTLYMQALGFGPADVSFVYETRALAKDYETKVMRKRSNLLKARYLAVTTGDMDLLDKTMERINKFRILYPRLMSGDTITRSYKSRRAAEREYISGIRFNRSFVRNLDPFFSRLENVNYYGLS